MDYNLTSSMSDRINYDEMVQHYARACCGALSDDEVLDLDPDQYAQDTYQLDQDAGTSAETDDPTEARCRFLAEFTAAVRDIQDETRLQLLDNWQATATYGSTTGFSIKPDGQKDGLPFGPVLLQCVSLDAYTIAFRVTTDTEDQDWTIGSTEDAANTWTDYLYHDRM